MTIWIHPVLNILLWGVYLAGGLGIIYFLAPQFGGWGTLNGIGKLCAILSLIFCSTVGSILIMTTVMPL